MFNKYQPRRDTGFGSSYVTARWRRIGRIWSILLGSGDKIRIVLCFFMDDNLLFALVFNLKLGSCELCGVIVIIVS